ncbi:MAG: hypothetical protein LBG92_09575 [Prevotellaceae bacterium]|nr:hypothetical protein [Prevotellaceae bacterium]
MKNIHDFNSKKIVGIGESVEYSANIRHAVLSYLKHLILNNNCKVIVFENSANTCMIYGLYTQGILPENAIKEISKDMASDYPTTEFLVWLRKHNSGQSEKVRMFGLGFLSPTSTFDYLLYLQDAGIITNITLLPEILKNWRKTTKLGEYVHSNAATIKKYVGETDYNYLKSIVDENDNIFRYNGLYEFETCLDSINKIIDLKRWNMFEKIISGYLTPDGILAIVSRSVDLNRKNSTYERHNILPDKKLGYFISQKYGNRYFCLSIQIGIGTYGYNKKNFVLEYPENHSFEKFCMNSKAEYIYCKSETLPKTFNKLRLVRRKDKNEPQFVYMDLNKRFDAFIFVRNSAPLQAKIYSHDIIKKRKQNIKCV